MFVVRELELISSIVIRASSLGRVCLLDRKRLNLNPDRPLSHGADSFSSDQPTMDESRARLVHGGVERFSDLEAVPYRNCN